MGASPWNVPANNGSFDDAEVIPAEQYPAVLVAVIDLGHQLTRKYQSSEQEWVRKIVLAWELTGYKGRPVLVKDFRLSGHKKAELRKFLEAWRGKPYGDKEPLFGLDDKGRPKVLGCPCLLKVGQKKSGDSTFNIIDGASQPTVGGQKIQVPAASRELLCWSVEDGKGAGALPDWLPHLYGKSLAERAMESREIGGDKGQAAVHAGAPAGQPAGAGAAATEDEIPF